jgi:hypothetical protein
VWFGGLCLSPSAGYISSLPQEIFPPSTFDFLAKQDDRMPFRIAIFRSIPYSANANDVQYPQRTDEVSPSWPRLFAQDISEIAGMPFVYSKLS